MNALKKIISVIIVVVFVNLFGGEAYCNLPQNIKNQANYITESPLHNKEFCSFSRHAKILTAGIHKVFRGLKFEHNAENGQNTKLGNGLLENQTDYTPEQIKAVTQYIATIIARVRFAEAPNIEYYNGNQLTDAQRLTVNQYGETIDKSNASGFFDPATATIYINAAKTAGSATNLINVIANETSHYIDYKNKIKFDGLYGTREKISDIASKEILNAWTEQFGTITYIPDPEYQTWLDRQTQLGAYILGNYNAGLVDDPEPLYDKPRSMIEVYRLFHAAKGDPYEAEWKYRHYYTRNALNSGLYENEQDAAADKMYQLQYNYVSIFHKYRDGENNKKYLLIDEYGASKEAVYDAQGKLVKDPANKGTYNFANDKIGHFFYDMLPYFKYGNSEDDPTTLWDRIKASGKSIKLFLEHTFKGKKDEEEK